MAGGIQIVSRFWLDSLSEAQTIIIPGWREGDERPPQALLDASREAHQRGARLLSICSGVFFIAATGLLGGERATPPSDRPTIWRCAIRQFPCTPTYAASTAAKSSPQRAAQRVLIDA
ncbi:DJ-1/PfpI family protein [Pantoea sp. KPR_PJ]|uniref:DJ-1/PfpI family protein n=1 Tax=Pantoea sp. KPR_PJ TaxID=2738375 RepID=UPI00352751D7